MEEIKNDEIDSKQDSTNVSSPDNQKDFDNLDMTKRINNSHLKFQVKLNS